MTLTTGPTAPTDTFVHPALFYRGRREYLDGTVPFVRAGLAAGEPVAVAVPGANLDAIRAGLGPDAASVHMLDMARAGRNPGRIIPWVLRAFADSHPGATRVRIIGEPIWPGRSATEYPACAQHEALINLAFTGRSVTILCPYDVDGLDPVVLADAAETHPVLVDADGERASATYAPRRVVAAYNRPLPPAPPTAVTTEFDLAHLALPRRIVAVEAARAGLAEDRVADLALAVNELASNSVEHGGGSGTFRVWVEDGRVACEVSDAGWLKDPLAGRLPVPPDGEGGRGLLLVNYLADLVRVHTVDGATTIRLYVAL